jgi:ABC-type antimicrobial peptide transport system permease subunit
MAGLAPSIFQGHLMVSERHLLQRFPSLGGARVLLVDAPTDRAAPLERALTGRLADLGLACAPTARRLAEFNSVENTYLSIFMLLGGLGVLLGSAGLGVVAARNILERRAELAVLRAVGFRRRHLRRLVFAEHSALALAGIVAGALAAGVAVTPALLAPEVRVPWAGLALTLGAIVAGSLLWIGLAVHVAMRGPVIPALRNE